MRRCVLEHVCRFMVIRLVASIRHPSGGPCSLCVHFLPLFVPPLPLPRFPFRCPRACDVFPARLGRGVVGGTEGAREFMSSDAGGATVSSLDSVKILKERGQEAAGGCTEPGGIIWP